MKTNVIKMDALQIESIVNKMSKFVDDDAKAILALYIEETNNERGSCAVSNFVTSFFKQYAAWGGI